MSSISPIFRPKFHFTAPYGWLNDPNGLVYDGKNYHLFYQSNPYGCDWNSMHWGHAVSPDMFHWIDLPIALTPEFPYEKHSQGGCFSGSAIYNAAKKEMFLFYTGSVPSSAAQQSQNLAISKNGVHFEKYTQNPIIPQHPPEIASREFRDPKVFIHDDIWYMVVASCIGDQNDGGDGRILLYSSPDGFSWDYKSILFASNGKYGSMFECPDFFFLDGKWVLIFSPMYMPGYLQCIWLVGSMDFETGVFTSENEGKLDYGYDHYAPQTFEGVNGERNSIAWMSSWPWMPWFNGYGPTEPEGYRGCMSLPRKYTLNAENELCSLPVSTLPNLYESSLQSSDISISETACVLSSPASNQYALSLLLNADETSSFTLTLMGGEVSIFFDMAKNEFVFTRNHDETGRICPLEVIDGTVSLQIIVDQSTVEIFSKTGKYAFSAMVYPGKENTEISAFSAEICTLKDFTLHTIKASMPPIKQRQQVWKETFESN